VAASDEGELLSFFKPLLEEDFSSGFFFFLTSDFSLLGFALLVLSLVLVLCVCSLDPEILLSSRKAAAAKASCIIFFVPLELLLRFVLILLASLVVGTVLVMLWNGRCGSLADNVSTLSTSALRLCKEGSDRTFFSLFFFFNFFPFSLPLCDLLDADLDIVLAGGLLLWLLLRWPPFCALSSLAMLFFRLSLTRARGSAECELDFISPLFLLLLLLFGFFLLLPSSLGDDVVTVSTVLLLMTRSDGSRTIIVMTYEGFVNFFALPLTPLTFDAKTDGIFPS
jgi:hypothetical protein